VRPLGRHGAPRRGNGRSTLVADEELLPFAPGSFDLVISDLSLHWVNDLPGCLLVRQCLKPDGLFLASLFGTGTLQELRTALMEAELAETGGASPRVSPFADLRDAAGLLQRAGFALPVADVDTVTVTYGDFFALLRDLRGMGEATPCANGRTARSTGRSWRALTRSIGVASAMPRPAHRHLPDHLSERLGAGRRPAAGARARPRADAPGRRPRHDRNLGRRQGAPALSRAACDAVSASESIRP
jgi:SAM-dependent methyltransferase